MVNIPEFTKSLMRKCVFTGIQHRDVMVFKNFRFRPFTRVQTKQQLGKLILGKTLTPDKVCTDLCIYLDSVSSLFSTLCKIKRVRHLFDKSILLIILNSLVFCKLFYCSTVWSGTTKPQNMQKL